MTTKQELNDAFSALCRVLGRDQGFEPGALHLEAYSPGDGVTRYRVVEAMEHGGITTPFGGLYFLGRGAAAQAFWFAARVAEAATRGTAR